MLKKYFIKSVVVAICGMTIITQGCSEEQLPEEPFLPVKPDNGVESNIRRVDNPYFIWAKEFPGMVGDSVARIEEKEVTITPTYRTFTESRMYSAPQVLFYSSGLYVPPAEIITVTVPESYGAKVKYQIGGFHCELDESEDLERHPHIVVRGELEVGENDIYNLFGGHLIFKFDQTSETPVTFKVKGAVESLDFIAGVTNSEQWLETIKNKQVPWGELRSERVVFTLPVETLKKVGDPQGLLDYYEEIIQKDYNDFHGFIDNAEDIRHRSPQAPLRFIVDKQLCAGSGHAGYPLVGGLGWGDRIINKNDWGVFHEIGHNYQILPWKWASMVETSCNFNIFHYMNRNGKWPGDKVESFQSIVEKWVINNQSGSKDFGSAAGLNEIGHTGRLVPFIQLAQEYGWKLYRYVSVEARNLSESERPISDSDKRHFFMRKACEYANANLLPFFKDWGLKYDLETSLFMNQFPKITAQNKFWTSFNKEVIPDVENEREPVRKNIPTVIEEVISTANWTKMAVSSEYSSSYSADKIWDGSVKSSWVTKFAKDGFGYPHAVEIDLGAEYTLTKFGLQQYNTDNKYKPKDFKLFVKESDEDNWIEVVAGQAKTGHSEMQYFNMIPVNARYVKFTGISSHEPTDYWMRVAEISLTAGRIAE